MLLLSRGTCKGQYWGRNVFHRSSWVRSYYKPKQKDAFFDVEGVVTKDTLLFRYEDVSRVRRTNFMAMTMLPLWAYLGQCGLN